MTPQEAENIHRCLTTVPAGVYFPNWNLSAMIISGTPESVYRFEYQNERGRVDSNAYRGDWVVNREGATIVIRNSYRDEYIRCILMGEFMAVRVVSSAPFEIFRFDRNVPVSEPGFVGAPSSPREGAFRGSHWTIPFSVGSWGRSRA